MSPFKSRDFEDRPLLVIWEMTQACDLRCVHCRASAQPQRHPHEPGVDVRRTVETRVEQVEESAQKPVQRPGREPAVAELHRA